MGNFVNKLSNYQVIPRELIFDNTLSDRARFVYCYMASKPNDWDFLMNPMSKEIGYSVETLRKYINELVENGWLVKGEQKNEGVFGAVTYTLNESKTQNKEKTHDEQNEEEETLDDTKNSDTEKFRHGENPTQYNIDTLHSRDERKGKEEIDKSISKKKTAYNANADLSYVDAPYAAIWQEWLDYKKEIKKQYKTQRGAESQYKVLIKYANNNPILANAIVKISIEHSWDGLFPLSDKQMAFFLSPNSPYAVEEKGYESQTNATIPPYESKSVPTNKIPNGLTKEQYDMYISNGYTIANDGILLKDGVFYK